MITPVNKDVYVVKNVSQRFLPFCYRITFRILRSWETECACMKDLGGGSVRQKGSHVTLRRNDTFVTVPLKMKQVGLLNKILKDCNILRDEFLESL